jgi:hypothetical protein
MHLIFAMRHWIVGTGTGRMSRFITTACILFQSNLSILNNIPAKIQYWNAVRIWTALITKIYISICRTISNTTHRYTICIVLTHLYNLHTKESKQSIVHSNKKKKVKNVWIFLFIRVKHRSQYTRFWTPISTTPTLCIVSLALLNLMMLLGGGCQSFWTISMSLLSVAVVLSSVCSVLYTV